MHPRDCPTWEYNTHPRCDQVLSTESTQILIALRAGWLDAITLCADTRPTHHRLFNALVPVGFGYYAGHYRGEPYRCLQFNRVRIQNDPRVGWPPERVLKTMELVAAEVQTTLKVLDNATAAPNAQIPPEEKRIYMVAFACHLLELFFRIHPYVNGNGHVGRFIVWSILGRYGYWPKSWPLHPRPPDPPYSELIARYRSGDLEPLETYMLQNIGR